MGAKINSGNLVTVADAVSLILGDDKGKIASTPFAVRSADGLDSTFYLDHEDGKIVVTGDSHYRRRGKPLSAAERKRLADIYLALLGVLSECGEGFFDSFHTRGGKALMNELEDILTNHAPEELAAVTD
ncbi:MAG: hypothetical protein K6F50_06305 [Kiritimatiellae bacterium]|nr:hypothetical protein [Kiritimatiellia bacterium]